MSYRNTLLLHVSDVAASIDFYGRLLDAVPLEASPTFALLPLPTGLVLGLWQRTGVVPPSSGAAGASELGLHLGSATEVDALYRHWSASGARILQAPIDLDFGRSFVAADPDGHWLRVYHVREA